MSTEEVKVILYTCDGCGRREMREQGDEVPFGYHGTVVRIDQIGGSGNVGWFACRESHISRAVLGALQKALDEHGA